MLRLTAPGVESFDLEAWADGVTTVSFEVGAPALREVVYDRPDGDGTDDLTNHVGGRVATAAVALGRVAHTRRALLDRMTPFLVPSRRITIEHSEMPGDPVRRLVVKPTPFDVAWANPGVVDLAWSFRTVGEPWWLGEAREVDLAPAPPPPGRRYPRHGNRVYPQAPVAVASAYNAGSLSAAWVWTITGPVRRPVLRNETTGDEVNLAGLVLLDGQVAVVDSVSKLVRVDGQVRHSVVDHAASRWWRVPPRAEVAVSMPVASAAGDAAGSLAFSDTFYA